MTEIKPHKPAVAVLEPRREMGGGVELLDGGAGFCCGFTLIIILRVAQVEFGLSCSTLGSAWGGNLTSVPKEKQQRLTGGQWQVRGVPIQPHPLSSCLSHMFAEVILTLINH